jgi:hypothetical protein
MLRLAWGHTPGGEWVACRCSIRHEGATNTGDGWEQGAWVHRACGEAGRGPGKRHSRQAGPSQGDGEASDWQVKDRQAN